METILVRAGTRLDQLLKIEALVSTGGEAKTVIQNGHVSVNNIIEIRRGYKLKDGDIIKFENFSIKIALE